MVYHLKEVDLAAHRYDPLQPRDEDGRWSLGGGVKREVKKFTTTKSMPGGKHLTMSGETSATRYKTDSLSLEEHRTKLDAALARAQNAQPGTTEHDHAWDEVSAHLESLSRKVETAKATNEEHRSSIRIRGANSTFDSTVYRMQTTFKEPPKPVGKAKEFLGEDAHHIATSKMGAMMVNIGARVAGVAAGLLGVGEAGHFSEAFRKLAENPGIEAGFNVAAAMLLSALAARISGAVKKHRDKKIARARGEA